MRCLGRDCRHTRRALRRRMRDDLERYVGHSATALDSALQCRHRGVTAYIRALAIMLAHVCRWTLRSLCEHCRADAMSTATVRDATAGSSVVALASGLRPATMSPSRRKRRLAQLPASTWARSAPEHARHFFFFFFFFFFCFFCFGHWPQIVDYDELAMTSVSESSTRSSCRRGRRTPTA